MYKQSFILLGSNGRKISLETGTHPCPRCDCPDTVQLTRFENELILFNKRIAFPRNTTVRYTCKECKWKNKALPDNDPSFVILEQTLKENGYFFTSQTTLRESRLPSFSSMTTPTVYPLDSASLNQRKSFLSKLTSNGSVL